jgi:uncharacterized YigZ family protein
MFETITKNIQEEIIEKKSKFIANIFYVETQQEAENKIKEMKKKYYDARHNCIAYRVIEKENIIEKSSDDGEPSGTAGAPMLDILKKQNLCNILVVVTRYFGGILLGTGGLVRAYSCATLKAISAGQKVKKDYGYEVEIKVDYNKTDNFKYYCKSNDINIVNIEYEDAVICKIELQKEYKSKLYEDIEQKKLVIRDLKELQEKIITIN